MLEYSWKNGHAIGQEPEEQMLVTEEAITGKRIRGGQRDAQRDHRVDRHVRHRVDVALVPVGICQDGEIVVEGDVRGQQLKAAEDVLVGLQRHADQPIDRHEGASQIQPEHEYRKPHRHVTPPCLAS
jgi:hypothetical protein